MARGCWIRAADHDRRYAIFALLPTSRSRGVLAVRRWAIAITALSQLAVHRCTREEKLQGKKIDRYLHLPRGDATSASMYQLLTTGMVWALRRRLGRRIHIWRSGW